MEAHPLQHTPQPAQRTVNQGMHLLVLVENTPAIGFYERLGGKRIEVVALDLGDETGQLGDAFKYYWENPSDCSY